MKTPRYGYEVIVSIEKGYIHYQMDSEKNLYESASISVNGALWEVDFEYSKGLTVGSLETAQDAALRVMEDHREFYDNEEPHYTLMEHREMWAELQGDCDREDS